jgi:small GTP-binding protein
MVDSLKLRIVVYKNSKAPSDGQGVLISPNWSKSQMLKLCSDTLNIKAKKIFNETGRELESFSSITEGSVLYISQGEGFQVVQSATKSCKTYVLCMLGAAAVGKSAVTQRYVANKFVRDYDPTIEDYYKRTSVIDEESTTLSILDTAGMEDYYPLIDDWIDKKDGFVLVYSVEWADSLLRLESFHEKILHRYPGKDPFVVIAANKVDSPNRTVTAEEGKKFADRLGVKHIEVSAATGNGIEEVFACIVRGLRAKASVAAPDSKKSKSKKSWCSLL